MTARFVVLLDKLGRIDATLAFNEALVKVNAGGIVMPPPAVPKTKTAFVVVTPEPETTMVYVPAVTGATALTDALPLMSVTTEPVAPTDPLTLSGIPEIPLPPESLTVILYVTFSLTFGAPGRDTTEISLPMTGMVTVFVIAPIFTVTLIVRFALFTGLVTLPVTRPSLSVTFEALV